MFVCCVISGKSSLKVREHKSLGPYVENLSKLAVRSFKVRVVHGLSEPLAWGAVIGNGVGVAMHGCVGEGRYGCKLQHPSIVAQ